MFDCSKLIIAWVIINLSPMLAQSGGCVTAIPPFIVNGISVNHEISDNVAILNNSNIPLCLNSGIVSSPPHVHLGVWIPPDGPVYNPFSYNLFFSKPVTYFEFFLLVGEDEDFLFESNCSSVELNDILMCFSIINLNTILLGNPPNVGYGHFNISFSEPVFSVNISGSGNGAGSGFQICSNSITPAPFWAGISLPEHVCTQDSVLFTAYEGEAGAHPPPYTFSYTLNGIAQTVTTTSTSDTVWVLTPTAPGTYTYQLLSVTDANGNSVNISCNNTRTVVVAQPPVAQFTASPTSGFAPLNINLQNQSSNATNYSWFVNEIGGFDTTQPPTSTAENPVLALNEIGVYEITLVAFNDLGCSDTAVQTVFVLEELHVVIPNVFTPNNDGINDWFGITSNVEANASIVILNRWGNVVFEKEFVTTPNVFESLWDGTSIGLVTTPGSVTTPSSGLAADGVYFYRVKVGGDDPKAIEFSGFVHLKK